MGTRTVLGVLAALAVTGYTMAAHAAMDMKIGFATINDPQHADAREIKKRIDADKSMGINVRVFPAGQLGTIPRMIEGLELGSLEVMLVPPGFLIGIDKAFEVLDGPGIFDSVAHAQRAMNDPEFYKKYSTLGDKKGIKIEALYVYGPSSWASKTPIRKLSDFNGLKVRVLATNIERAVAAAVGATGVPMPFTQVLPALQRGTIDGVRASIIAMGGAKFYTVTKYITLTGATVFADAILVSEPWLKRLSPKQRRFVETTLHGMTHWAYETGLDYGKKAEKLWRDNGAEIIHLPPADQKEFMARVRPLSDKYLGSDPKTRDMYALLKEAIARTAK